MLGGPGRVTESTVVGGDVGGVEEKVGDGAGVACGSEGVGGGDEAESTIEGEEEAGELARVGGPGGWEVVVLATGRTCGWWRGGRLLQHRRPVRRRRGLLETTYDIVVWPRQSVW